jgi:hypothetical protein
MTASRTNYRGTILVTITAFTIAGCGSSSHHAIGTVSLINPGSICVARHNAEGDCYLDPSKQFISTVRVGECVDATYFNSKQFNRPQLKAIKPANADDHRSDCPATLPTPP